MIGCGSAPPVRIVPGRGGVDLVERGHPVGIEGVADSVAAPLALDGGDDMGARPVAEVDAGLVGGHGG